MSNAVTQRLDFSVAEANRAWLDSLPEQKILRPDVPTGVTQPIGVVQGGAATGDHATGR